MKKLILLLLALTSLGASAASHRWEEAAASAELTSYIDHSTLMRKGNNVQVWTLYDYKAALDSGFGPFKSLGQLQEYRCDRRQSRILELVQYAGPMATGGIVKNLGKDPSGWSNALPGSVTERNLQYACNPKLAKAKRSGNEAVNAGGWQNFKTQVTNTCMRLQFVRMVTADAKASGKSLPEGFSAESLPLDRMRAGFQADPALRKLDAAVVAGCDCQNKPMVDLIKGARTESGVKAATAQIAKMPQDPAFVKHVQQCWDAANAQT